MHLRHVLTSGLSALLLLASCGGQPSGTGPVGEKPPSGPPSTGPSTGSTGLPTGPVSDGARQVPGVGSSPLAGAQAIPGSVRVTVKVPPSLATAPFNEPRQLVVPPGFEISVYARIPKARFMAVTPGGDLLVSQPAEPNTSYEQGQPFTGSIYRVTRGPDGTGQVSTFASGLKFGHDMVFKTIDGVTYLYVAESHQITRSVYENGDTKRREATVVVGNLPDKSSPELKGAYGHPLKNIAIDGNNKLYVSVASVSNDDPADVTSTPPRAAIFQYNADGSGGRVFATGLRNAEGLDFVPGTNDLWVVVNNRDNIAYPFNNDWQNDGTGNDFGKVIPSYVDNHPPEEFTRVRDGGNYGWPYCNPNPDAGLDNMPYDRDARNNPNGDKLDCNKIDRINKGIQAHSAPLGLTFLQNSKFAEAYRNGAVTGLHGCWNCTAYVGHKVSYFPWVNGGPGPEMDLVTGWVTDAVKKLRWGRPVDAVPDQDGNLLISDDYAGVIYKLSPTGTTPPSTPPTTTPVPSGYQNIVSKSGGKCLDVRGASLANGASIKQWPCSAGQNQQFTLVPASAGYHRIVARHSSKLLDVAEASPANGARIIQWESNGGQNQEWKVVGTGDGFVKLLARHSGKALDVPGCSTADGTLLQQWPDLNNDCQKFQFKAAPQ